MRLHRTWTILLLATAVSASPALAQKPPATPATAKPAAAKPAAPKPAAPKPAAPKPATAKPAAAKPAATSAAAAIAAATNPTPTSSAAASAAPATSASASPDSAGPDTNEPESSNEKVRELFKEGNKHYRAGKWAEAETAFEAAWALTDKKSKGIVNNLGQTKMHLQKYREAAELLSIARRLAAKDDKQLADIERDLAEAKKHVGTLVVTASADGAEIKIGEKSLGASPLADPVFVDPGKVTITATKETESAKMELDVQAGQEVQVPLALLKPPPPTPVVTATATAPPPPPSSFKLKPMLPGLVAGGVGVVSIVIGGALIGAAFGAEGGIQEKSAAIKSDGGKCPADPRCADLEGAATGGDAMSRAGVGVLVVGVLLAAAGGGYMVWQSRKAKQSTVGFMPVASPQGAGFVTVGSF